MDRSTLLRRVHRALALALVAAVPAAARAQTPPASAQPATPAPRTHLDVDRVVAVIGDQPILYSELLDEILQRRASGMQIPEDSAGRVKMEHDILSEMVDA